MTKEEFTKMKQELEAWVTWWPPYRHHDTPPSWCTHLQTTFLRPSHDFTPARRTSHDFTPDDLPTDLCMHACTCLYFFTISLVWVEAVVKAVFREYLAIFKKTVAMHEVFLCRVAAHPVLRKDLNFHVFLEYNQDVSHHAPTHLWAERSHSAPVF